MNQDIRKDIIHFGKLLYKKGLVAGMDGNISIRMKDHIFITASGVHKGLLSGEHILEIGLDGSLMDGTMRPSSESLLHLEIYKRIPRARSVIHAHSPWSTAVSLSADTIDLNVLAEGKIVFGEVDVIPYEDPGSRQLAFLSAEAAERAKIHILKAHGVVAWGESITEAFCLVEALEQNIKILGLSGIWSLTEQIYSSRGKMP